MQTVPFTLAGSRLQALGSGALWWEDRRLLCVSDLHLGASGPDGTAQTRDTLLRLESDLTHTGAATVICLGNSFDTPSALEALTEEDRLWIARLQAGRRWVWIEGNHDPGPIALGGSHLSELPVPPLTFRHMAKPRKSGEISGYYHPQATVRTRHRTVTRAAFLYDSDRVILPAYGLHTGGLRNHDETLTALMRSEARAILTGQTPRLVDMPR